MQSERIASENLNEYSQSTHYIFDWTAPLRQAQTSFKENNTLTHKKASEQRLFLMKKVKQDQAIKQISEHKNQKKQDILSRFQFTILEEPLGKASRTKMLVKDSMKLTMCQSTKSNMKKPGIGRVIDKIVQEQFKKINDYEYRTIRDHRRERLLSYYQKPQKLLKTKSNSLPFINSQKKNLQDQTNINRKNQPIFINNYEPEDRQKPNLFTTPTCRNLNSRLLK